MGNEFFRNFVGTMDAMLRENEREDGRNQKELLNKLFSIEKDFRKVLLSSAAGRNLYQEFVDFILKEGDSTRPDKKEGFVPKTAKSMKKFKEQISMEGRNILRARPYFRERQNTFSDRISKAFHKNKPEMLHKFKINYEFAKWAMDRYTGPHRKKLTVLYNNIIEIRKLLCTNNLPLAINRAHIFWSKVPASHLEYMDLIQNCSEGLLTAIDKFVPPYKTVFRSTAIGRMTLNMMENNNATMVKLPPKEKRVLYRVKNARQKENLTKDEEVLDYVKESFKGVTSDNLTEIEAAAAQIYNLDDKQEDAFSLAEKLPDSAPLADESVISRDLKFKLDGAINKLTVLELKVLKLKLGSF
jgi:DNA-directed RNA polymerase sigma subunit (sigma70/sigma32)